MRASISLIALVALGPLFVSACKGWVGKGDTYHARRGGSSPEATYRFGLPGPAWEPLSDSHVQVAWRHRDHPSVIHLRSQCEEHGDSSIEQFADHLLIDWRDARKISQTTEPFAGRTAARTVIEGELDGGPTVRAELLVFKKNGCLFDLQLLAPPRHFDQDKAAFDAVTAGFVFPLPP